MCKFKWTQMESVLIWCSNMIQWMASQKCTKQWVFQLFNIIIRFLLALFSSLRSLEFLIELSVERLQRVSISAHANHIFNVFTFVEAQTSVSFRVMPTGAYVPVPVCVCVCVCFVFFCSPILTLNQRNILFCVQFASFLIVHSKFKRILISLRTCIQSGIQMWQIMIITMQIVSCLCVELTRTRANIKRTD